MKNNCLILVSLILLGSFLVKSEQKTDDLESLPPLTQTRECDWSDVLDSSYVDRLGIRVFCKKKSTYLKELKKLDL